MFMCKGKQNIAGFKALSEQLELNFTYNNHIIVYYHVIILLKDDIVILIMNNESYNKKGLCSFQLFCTLAELLKRF